MVSDDALQRGLDAVCANGGIGVLAKVVTPAGAKQGRAGVADKETGEPVDFDSRFRVGFVNQSFTATVVLQLVGEGKLNLDDTVEDWFPGLVQGNGNDGNIITVRHLLSHTSGLFDYPDDVDAIPAMNFPEPYLEHWNRDYTPEELVGIAVANPPRFATGESFGFSNTGYVLLGMMIDRISTRGWATEITERIIKPLNLASTELPGANPDLPTPHPKAYAGFNAGDPVEVTRQNMTVVGASGSLVSTPGDLITFFTALNAGSLLAPEQQAAMFDLKPASQLDAIWPGVSYGLGLMRIPLSTGGGYVGHAGGMPGWITRGGVTEDGTRGAVVITTGDISLDVEKAIDQLIDDLLTTD